MSQGYHLFVAHNHRIGGAEKSLFLLVTELARRGRACGVVVPARGPFAKRLVRAGVEVFVVPFHPVYGSGSPTRVALRLMWMGLSGPAVRRQFRELGQRIRPAVVHVNGLPCPFAAVFGSMGIPMVWHVRELYGGLAGKVLRRAAERSALRVVCISEACRRPFHRSPSKTRVVVVPNGVVVPENMPEWKCSGGPAVVGAFSQLIPEKGHEILLSAARAVIAVRPEVRFAIFGEDPAPGRPRERELRNLCHRLGLAGSVEFRGNVDSPEETMARMDALCLSSWAEPSGRVLLEGMAHGAPLVASHGGGVGEIVADEDTALLFPPGDADACARQLLRILSDPPLAQRLRTRAYQRVRARFSSETHADAMEVILDAVADGLPQPG